MRESHNPYAPPKAAPRESQVGVSRGVLLLVAGVFIAYGVYAILQARNTPSAVLSVLFGLVSVLGGVGVALRRPWCRFCIYIVSIGLVGTWLYYTAVTLQYQGWPNETALLLGWLISLFPGLCVVVIAAGSSYLVSRHFRRK